MSLEPKTFEIPDDVFEAIRLSGDPRGYGTCSYCGDPLSTETVTRDHVVPRSRGGSSRPENLVDACRSCNSAKGARTPEEWFARLDALALAEAP